MNLAMVYVEPFIAGANGKDVCNGCGFVNHKEYLALEVYLDMRVSGISWQRPYCHPQRLNFIASQLSGSFAAFDFLKSNERVTRSRIENTVNWSGPVAEY